jgi:hypothetical protein
MGTDIMRTPEDDETGRGQSGIASSRLPRQRDLTSVSGRRPAAHRLHWRAIGATVG